MINDEIILRAKINQKGEFVVLGMNDMNKFITNTFNKSQSLNPGKDVDLLLKITKLPSKGREKRIGYLYGKVFPEFGRAFRESGYRLTAKQIIEKVKQMSKTCRNREIEDLNWYELGDLIDELKEIAAEHFNFYIDESVTI